MEHGVYKSQYNEICSRIHDKKHTYAMKHDVTDKTVTNSSLHNDCKTSKAYTTVLQENKC